MSEKLYFFMVGKNKNILTLSYQLFSLLFMILNCLFWTYNSVKILTHALTVSFFSHFLSIFLDGFY